MRNIQSFVILLNSRIFRSFVWIYKKKYALIIPKFYYNTLNKRFNMHLREIIVLLLFLWNEFVPHLILCIAVKTCKCMQLRALIIINILCYKTVRPKNKGNRRVRTRRLQKSIPCDAFRENRIRRSFLYKRFGFTLLLFFFFFVILITY